MLESIWVRSNSDVHLTPSPNAVSQSPAGPSRSHPEGTGGSEPAAKAQHSSTWQRQLSWVKEHFHHGCHISMNLKAFSHRHLWKQLSHCSLTPLPQDLESRVDFWIVQGDPQFSHCFPYQMKHCTAIHIKFLNILLKIREKAASLKQTGLHCDTDCPVSVLSNHTAEQRGCSSSAALKLWGNTDRWQPTAPQHHQAFTELLSEF